MKKSSKKWLAGVALVTLVGTQAGQLLVQAQGSVNRLDVESETVLERDSLIGSRTTRQQSESENHSVQESDVSASESENSDETGESSNDESEESVESESQESQESDESGNEDEVENTTEPIKTEDIDWETQIIRVVTMDGPEDIEIRIPANLLNFMLDNGGRHVSESLTDEERGFIYDYIMQNVDEFSEVVYVNDDGVTQLLPKYEKLFLSEEHWADVLEYYASNGITINEDTGEVTYQEVPMPEEGEGVTPEEESDIPEDEFNEITVRELRSYTLDEINNFSDDDIKDIAGYTKIIRADIGESNHLTGELLAGGAYTIVEDIFIGYRLETDFNSYAFTELSEGVYVLELDDSVYPRTDHVLFILTDEAEVANSKLPLSQYFKPQVGEEGEGLEVLGDLVDYQEQEESGSDESSSDESDESNESSGSDESDETGSDESDESSSDESDESNESGESSSDESESESQIGSSGSSNGGNTTGSNDETNTPSGTTNTGETLENTGIKNPIAGLILGMSLLGVSGGAYYYSKQRYGKEVEDDK